ncbi:MAG: hypothetical protein ACK5UZ_22255, partial [Pseudanabaena sp.]
VLEALNLDDRPSHKAHTRVSIHKRVLEAWNPKVVCEYCQSQNVSIPKRVLEALNPSETNGTYLLLMFQSLKGF